MYIHRIIHVHVHIYVNGHVQYVHGACSKILSDVVPGYDTTMYMYMYGVFSVMYMYNVHVHVKYVLLVWYSLMKCTEKGWCIL